MKDIVITSKQQKAELLWLAVCFMGAVLLNIVSIIWFHTNWSEAYTQILWVLLFTCILYALSVGIRIAIFLFKRLFRKK